MRSDLRRSLERIEIPGEHDARLRAWETLRTAFAEREPVSWRRRRRLRPVVAIAVGAALVAAAASPPGRAVLDSVREAIGVERAQPALFSLPAPGRLLVDSVSGPWVVRSDGSKRLLGEYREASWSPFGRYVVAGRANELAALEPDGDVRWSLARPSVRYPRWGGSRVDTRIAYLSGDTLRVVAGDGTGDRELAPAAAVVAPAWRPDAGEHVLAYADREGRLHAVDAELGRERWSSRPGEQPLQIAWSADGSRLLALGRESLRVFRADGRLLRTSLGGSAVAAAPGGRRYAVIRRAGAGSTVVLDDGRRLFSGPGAFSGAAWSPDGRWLLVAWADADQWVFLRAAGARRVEAVSAVTQQFGGGFPALAGWCCPEG